jgi:RNA recognition motif-containing protein
VVVHNLPWSTTWQQLKDLFKEWKVDRADVVYDTWGKSR